MINVHIAERGETEKLTRIRLECLRTVQRLPQDYIFPQELVREISVYFTYGDHTTAIAEKDGHTVGCASVSWLHVMPTMDHPTGRRGHVMNVYVSPSFRRRGIAERMLRLLISEAKARSVTELSLDATEEGMPLYLHCGFKPNTEGMTLDLKEYSE